MPHGHKTALRTSSLQMFFLSGEHHVLSAAFFLHYSSSRLRTELYPFVSPYSYNFSLFIPFNRDIKRKHTHFSNIVCAIHHIFPTLFKESDRTHSMPTYRTKSSQSGELTLPP